MTKREERRIQQKEHNYAYMRLYCSIEDMGTGMRGSAKE